MSSRRLGLLAVCLMVVLTGCWAQPGFDPGRSRWNAAERTLRSDTVDELRSLWVRDLTNTRPQAVNDPIVVSDTVYASTEGGVVVSLHGRSGDRRWKVRPTVERPRDIEQFLGDPAWKDGELHIPFMIPSSSTSGGIAALDQDTGRLNGATFGIGIIGDLAVKADRIVHRNCRVDRGPGGAEISGWTFTPSMSMSGFASGCGGFAFVGDVIVWEDPGEFPAGYVSSSPMWVNRAVVGSNEYPAAVGTTRAVWGTDSGKVWVLNVNTGAVAWTAQLPSAITQPAAVTDSAILVATDGGKIYALPRNGCGARRCTPLWEGITRFAASSPPAAAADVVYVGTVAGRIKVFDIAGCGARSCRPIVTLNTGGSPVTGGPIVSNRVYAGTKDGRLFAFGL